MSADWLTRGKLADEEEYEDIRGYQEECGKYGEVRSLEIAPRPVPGVEVPGCGKVFIETLPVENARRPSTLTGGKLNQQGGGDQLLSTPDKYHRRDF